MQNRLRNSSYPSYLHLSETGKLKKIVKQLYKALENCKLSPRECKINRLSDEKGFCKVKKLAMVSNYAPHFGEERPLVGTSGSGTIFMTNCNLGCVYCQNYDISQLGRGKEVEVDELAEYMIYLQKVGCHNINFVTPTHVIAQIVAALEIAIKKGINVPLIYNCGGYESVQTLKLVEGVFDIYMPDIKYGSRDVAQKLSHAKDYPIVVKKAVKEMHRQVGDLVINKNGIATRGLLVRHLVLPGNLAGTEQVLRFLAEEISTNSYLNIMDQYRPCHKAFKYPPLDRPIQYREYKNAVELALAHGFKRIDSHTKYPIDGDSLF